MGATDVHSDDRHSDDRHSNDRHTDDRHADEAVAMAERLLRTSLATCTHTERRRLDRLGRLLADPDGRELVFALTDEVLRIDDPHLAADRFADVVARHPTRAIGPLDRVLLALGSRIAPHLARLTMPLVLRRIRRETHGMVLAAEDPAFARHVRERALDGVRLNVNPLGEAILSDAEADERMALVLARIDRDDVDYVSVKASAIVANLDSLALDHSIDRVADALRMVFRRTMSDGLVTRPHTFVNVDMEEYRDLELTLTAFTRVLAEPELSGLDAGIVLQAYLPDSHDALERLGNWARERRSAGGGRIKVRLVKGANLAMEHVEAELHRWTPAPYSSKDEVDASYKAMLDRALAPEWADALRIGVASHNLFDVAWALVVAREAGALDRVEFEMLEGMAPAQARAVAAATGGLLMYSPVVRSDDFAAAIAYLTRRLDENTQPDNFLRALFALRPGSEEFAEQERRFRRSVTRRHAVDGTRRRHRLDPAAGGGFANAADSDPTDPATRGALLDALRQAATPAIAVPVPVTTTDAIDVLVDRAAPAVADVVADARRVGWLLAAADLMEAERCDTIGLMAAEVAKTAREADPEVSEAIDFCRYYATDGRDVLDVAARAGCTVSGRGLVVVAGPWNFPYAIPTGGVAAAVAAGNSVVLKPAPEATAVGARIVDQFHRAGVPTDVVQLAACADGPVAERLVGHERIDTVVLTGSYATASMFLRWRPDRRVVAETSGKNAIVVTPSADLDQAIADVVHSAFGHAGQKCSAASLAICVGSVYDDPTFRRRLAAAVRSWRIGPATDPATMMGPLIAPPSGALARALTELDAGESWLVEPRRIDERTWSPGVRVGVRPGSWFHLTECFGPVLGVMRAADLDEAIAIQNATDYGLTGGIQSLDDAEVERWLDGVRVGNAYVNRHITGAIVRRQPFGGWKRSSVGGGAKAGGPGYVAQFARIRPGAVVTPAADELDRRFSAHWRELQRPTDASGLRAEANLLRHHPATLVVVRHEPGDGRVAALVRIGALTGVPVELSSTGAETDDEFVTRVLARRVLPERVRLLTALADAALGDLHAADVAIDREPPLPVAEVELRRWVREQSVSRTLHRHGRVRSAQD